MPSNFESLFKWLGLTVIEWTSAPNWTSQFYNILLIKLLLNPFNSGSLNQWITNSSHPLGAVALQGAHTGEVSSAKTAAKERTHILLVLEGLYPISHKRDPTWKQGQGEMSTATLGWRLKTPLICCNPWFAFYVSRIPIKEATWTSSRRASHKAAQVQLWCDLTWAGFGPHNTPALCPEWPPEQMEPQAVDWMSSVNICGHLKGWSINEGSKERKWCVGGEDNEDVLDNMGPEPDMKSMELRMGWGFVGVICTDFHTDKVHFLLGSLYGFMLWICKQISTENTWMF